MVKQNSEIDIRSNIASYKTALTKVLYLHLIMFVISFAAAIIAKSTSVLADSLDFIGDAASYFLSFYVLGRSPIFQTIIATVKASSMIIFNIPVFVYAFIRLNEGSVPNYEVMGLSGIAGIITHIYCIKILYKFKDGDSNRLSVWICTINDLLCNVLTVLASIMVFRTQSVIPDITAAIVIVFIAFIGAFVILRQALKEFKNYRKI